MKNKKIFLILGLCIFLFINSVLAINTTNVLHAYNYDINNSNQIDSHGSNDGTVAQAIFTYSGITDGAFIYDGINDYIDYGTVNPNFGTDDWAISLCFNQYTGGSYQALISQHDSALPNDGGWMLGLKNTNVIQFFRADGNGGIGLDTQLSAENYIVGDDNHLIINVDYGNSVELFLNGVLLTDGSSTFGSWGTFQNNHRLRTGIMDTGRAFDGLIDNVFIFDEVLLESEITDLYNGGDCLGYDFSDGEIFYYNMSLPLNNTIVNNDWNGTIILNTNTTFSSCTINNSIWNTSTNNGTFYAFYNSTALVNQHYDIEFICNGVTKDVTFGYDTVLPIVIEVAPGNNSINVNELLFSHVGFYDLNGIWQYNITIFDINGSLISNDFATNISINETVEEIHIARTVNTSHIPDGNYTFFIEVWDTHTDKDITNQLKEYETEKLEKNILKENYKDIEIQYTYNDDVNVTSENKIDKIIYKIDSEKIKNEYIIESNKDIVYLENSEYKCHFIIDNTIFHDCEGLENQRVTKINDNKYKVTFDKEIEKMVFTKSTGFLNYNSVIYYVYIGYPPGTIIEVVEGEMTMYEILIIGFIIYIILWFFYFLSKFESPLLAVVTALGGLFLAVDIYKAMDSKMLALLFFIVNAVLIIAFKTEK